MSGSLRAPRAYQDHRRDRGSRSRSRLSWPPPSWSPHLAPRDLGGPRWRRSARDERPDTGLDRLLVLPGVAPGDTDSADEDPASLEGHPAREDDHPAAGHGVVAEE